MGFTVVKRAEPKHSCDLPGHYNTYYSNPGTIIRCADCGQHWRFQRTWYLIRGWVKIGASEALR